MCVCVNFLGDESGSGEVGSEVSSTHSEGVGLHWVAGLRLLPLYSGKGREGEGEGGSWGPSREDHYCDIDGIIETLEVS